MRTTNFPNSVDHCENVQETNISEPVILPRGDGTDVAFPADWTEEQIQEWRNTYRVCAVSSEDAAG